MKTYLPYFCKKIGIILVIIAFIPSIIANINEFCNGFIGGYNADEPTMTETANFKIISTSLGKTLTWISLSFSFRGFFLYLIF